MQDESARRFDRLKSAGREPTSRAALFPPALLAQDDGPNQSRNGFTSNSCAERCRWELVISSAGFQCRFVLPD